MNDHSYFEELAALAAGKHLSEVESGVLREHMAVCSDCRKRAMEFQYLVQSELPLLGDYSFVRIMAARPEAGMRERFLAKARSEGARFSPDVHKPVSAPWFLWSYRAAMVGLLATILLVAGLYGPSVVRRIYPGMQPIQDANRIKQQNGDLQMRLAEREREAAAQQKEIETLRSQLVSALKTAENYRIQGEEKRVTLGQSTIQTAQLLDELQDREKQLTSSAQEIARINQLRATDRASLEAQQARIKEISDQLRVAEATLDMERQLAAAGRDIRELLIARQLHVIDVRDMDADGKPGQAFARVFVTEEKSLMFFAFDLNNPKAINPGARFQVWGEQIGKKDSVRSLGVLSKDDKAQNRWELKVENAHLLSQVNSVFVTLSSAGGGSGRRMLYAYLG